MQKIWDLYNENRELLGKKTTSEENKLPMRRIPSGGACLIRNSNGQYLISQRSATDQHTSL